MRYKPHDYQAYAIKRIIDQEAVGLFLDMGLGKTSITLTAVEELLFNRFQVGRVLVTAPLRAAEDTWTREADKWAHLHHLRVSRVLGTAKQRQKALAADADIYVINHENLVWLIGQYKGKKNPWPFDAIVIDELSKFKDPGTERFRYLRRVMPAACRRIGLTGTPAPEGYINLWSQVYLLDQGARLGRTVTEYRQRWFHAEEWNPRTGQVFKYALNEGAKEEIDAALADLCVSMSAEDFLAMPERQAIVTPVQLTPAQAQQYKALKRDYLIQVDEDTITAGTAAAVYAKLQQFAQGAVYTTDAEQMHSTGDWIEIHDAKLRAMDDIVAAANGKPVLCFYWFKHDLARLRARYPDARELRGQADVAAWNTGEVPLLLAHPASAGHGLNLQDGGNHVVWFSLTWNLELYQQANARLYRQGQQASTVVIQHLVAEGTEDERIMLALEGKAETQRSLMDALKADIRDAKGAAS